jgi:hypothetical protein
LRIDRGDDLQEISKGTAIIYDARVEDIGDDDVLEMLYELHMRIERRLRFENR